MRPHAYLSHTAGRQTTLVSTTSIDGTHLPLASRRTSSLLSLPHRLDVVIQMEEVFRVVTRLQRGQPCQLGRAVSTPHSRLTFVGQVVDVGPTGERLHGCAVAPSRRNPIVVLIRFRPTRAGDELNERVAMAEGGFVITDGGDRSTPCLKIT